MRPSQKPRSLRAWAASPVRSSVARRIRSCSRRRMHRLAAPAFPGAPERIGRYPCAPTSRLSPPAQADSSAAATTRRPFCSGVIRYLSPLLRRRSRRTRGRPHGASLHPRHQVFNLRIFELAAHRHLQARYRSAGPPSPAGSCRDRPAPSTARARRLSACLRGCPAAVRPTPTRCGRSSSCSPEPAGSWFRRSPATPLARLRLGRTYHAQR